MDNGVFSKKTRSKYFLFLIDIYGKRGIGYEYSQPEKTSFFVVYPGNILTLHVCFRNLCLVYGKIPDNF